MITGEERLRENLTDLYGNVVGYDGRPSNDQVQRAEALAKESADAAKAFDAWLATKLPALNDALAKAKLDAITPLSHDAWEKSVSASSSGAPKNDEFFERD